MDELELCRLCANFADDTNSEKLFERNQRNLLRQVKDLTGLQLKNAADLPQFICEPCQEQTLQAHQFRERCIRVQKQFVRAARRVQLNRTKLEPVEEEFLEEFDAVKEETNESREDVCSPIAESCDVVLHSLAPIDPNDSSNNDANCLPLDDYETYHFDLLNEPAAPSSPMDALELHFEVTSKVALSPKILNDDNTHTSTKITSQKTKRKRKSGTKAKQPQVKKEKVDLRKCKSKRLLICELCGKHFHSPSSFEVHMSRHTGDKQFQCERCPDKFFTKSDLKRHTYKHTGERPVQCRYCERRFIDHSFRTKHERTHTNERPHACSECDKKFNQKQHLDVHMQLHTGERFFSCAVCNATFQRHSNMKAHFSTLIHKQNVEKQLKLENQTNETEAGGGII